ncbi:hypothetical protein [Deinococcus rubellus]|uniref:Nuclease associated modular domain-containing protein n=1 Tax=Deinococcus rubellus TaxID=1889240 RepID=A0ABY5YEE7_9DEIO|nr:hypothetical protein [Deinococcus rubellus]UWX62767.1 hypothetical protein N0D28_08270 [Deinococcus rubellus]
MTNTTITSIYGLIDPRTQELRYVGKAQDMRHRYRRHISKHHLADNTYKNRWIKSVLSEDLKPEMFLIERCIEESWREAEVFWISYFRSIGCRLTNLAPGGEGTGGYKHSELARANMAEAQRKIAHVHRENSLGRRLSVEAKGKIRASKLGKERPAEVVEKIRVALTGRKQPAELVARRAESNRGKKHTPEQCAAISKRMTGRKAPKSQDAIEAHRESCSRHWLLTDPEGLEIEVKNLKAFCRNNSLSDASMGSVAKGRQKSHKGWRCVKIAD